MPQRSLRGYKTDTSRSGILQICGAGWEEWNLKSNNSGAHQLEETNLPPKFKV